MSKFEREERYIVLKLKDLEDFNICQDMIDTVRGLEAYIQECRDNAGKILLECAVIESDWPEYEVVWKMIENRVRGDES